MSHFGFDTPFCALLVACHLLFFAEDDLSNQTFDGAEVCENILHINDQDADECDKEDASMFSLLEQRMEDVTTAMDGGVLKRMLRPGAGPIAPLGSLVHGIDAVQMFLFTTLTSCGAVNEFQHNLSLQINFVCFFGAVIVSLQSVFHRHLSHGTCVT